MRPKILTATITLKKAMAPIPIPWYFSDAITIWAMNIIPFQWFCLPCDITLGWLPCYTHSHATLCRIKLFSLFSADFLANKNLYFRHCYSYSLWQVGLQQKAQINH